MDPQQVCGLYGIGGVVATPDGCAAIEGDLDSLWEWINRNLRNILHMGKINPKHQHRLGASLWKILSGMTWGSWQTTN